jgi:hypothetical protein
MIDLAKLVSTTPLPEENKKEILDQIPNLTPDKIFDLTNMCWDLISSDVENKLRIEAEKMLLDPSLPLLKEDLNKKEEEMFQELISKLSAVDDQEKIDEIKQKLEESKNNFTTQT